MAVLISPLQDINKFLDKYADQRTADWPTISSVFFPIGISIAYIFTVKVLGPWLMKDKSPFQLRRTLIAYNFVQIVINVYVFYKAATYGWITGGYSYRCQPVDYSDNPSALEMAKTSYVYYVLKYFDLLDTIFFVLRKKNDHITVLHLYHHSIMPNMVWIGIKFAPGGNSTFFGFLNAFVHIIMHSYYLLSALGPQMQPYLWWKKYVTTIQLIQFVIVLIHALQSLILGCDYPIIFSCILMLQGCVFLVLFGNFYIQSYVVKKSPKPVHNTNGYHRTKTD